MAYISNSESVANYDDLENKFPVEIDDFEKFIDPDISAISLINQYYSFYNAGNIQSATQILNDNKQLKRMILNAESLNKIRDAIISIERLYMSDLQKYLINLSTYRGEYSSGIKYNKYDVVVYENEGYKESFMCARVDTPIGTVPTNNSFWTPLVIRGQRGNSGLNLVFKGAYNSGLDYVENDCVQYNGSLYGALKPSRGTPPTPNGDNEYWALAWDFQIPDNYITMNMLASDVKTILNNANTFTDVNTGYRYRWGAENGVVFIEEVGVK